MSRGANWAIQVEGLAKRYQMGETLSDLRQTIDAGARRLAGRIRGRQPAADPGEFWALKDITFEVASGEVVGIVGQNGAGKSTLLKVLSRITEPTRGEARFRGRIGSLLEVGAGFHPELSGRDNVFLNGAILGMKHREIVRQFDQIVEFAGVADFIDTPVKRYSSGMYMRLAFAVAAHLDTDILLADEVLAVGDAAFQRKCLARMGEFGAGGRTVLFVSHNMEAVRALCRRCIYLDHGVVAADGPTREVLAAYSRSGGDGQTGELWWSADRAPTGDPVRLRRASVRPHSDDPLQPMDITCPIACAFEYEMLASERRVVLSVVLTNSQGVLVFNVSDPIEHPPVPAGLYREVCVIPGNLLNADTYTLSVELREDGELVLSLQNLLMFEVLDHDQDRRGWYGKWEGVLRPRLEWRCERLAAEPSRPVPPIAVERS